MKQFLLKSLIVNFLFFSSYSLMAQVNNVKLLDLTANTYSGSASQSFFVKDSSQIQVTSQYTFEAWIYVDSYTAGNYPVIMDRRTVFSLYLIATSTTGDYRIRFVARDNSDNIIASMRNDGTSGSTDCNMVFQEWYHVAVTRDGTTARLYIDGTQYDSSTDPDFVLSTPTKKYVNFGARYWGAYQRFFDGALDEIRYSDTARYTTNFTITPNSKPHPTSGDPHTILLFNFDNSSVANSTSANNYFALKHNSPFTYANWDGFPGDELPLPVKYIEELQAKLNNKNTVDLSWATASEEINNGFIILRSQDAQHWDSIGFVAGAGNSNTLRRYHFTDSNPLKNNYYQLKQMDYNGAAHLSKICYLSCELEESLSIYPNPAHDFIVFKGIDKELIEKTEIYNITGKMAKSLLPQSNMIDISDLAQGYYYFLVFDKAGQIYKSAFIKQP